MSEKMESGTEGRNVQELTEDAFGSKRPRETPKRNNLQVTAHRFPGHSQPRPYPHPHSHPQDPWVDRHGPVELSSYPAGCFHK
jgi:hypothetical protein